MQEFQNLGARIEREWRESNFNEETFPAIAAEALRQAHLPEKLSAWDIVDWSLSQTELPPQRDLNANFGDPPVTIYSSPRFFIDVYFWFEGTTSIHQHGFCGAFQVLLGSSIHSWYEFECHEAINTFTEIGDMTLKLCELLEAGDIQEIRAGRQYIHSLFHLDYPSATIVVRTEKSPLHLPQFSYEKPHLAVDPFFEESTTTKKLQMLAALFRAGREDADTATFKWLDEADLQTSYVILVQLRKMLRGNQLRELFKVETANLRFDRFLDAVAKRHGAAGEALRPVFERYETRDEIVSRRSYVTNPEHRFFMALLLNVEGRDRILGLINQRFPESDGVEKVLDWVFDLAQARVVAIETTNALGIADFGDVEMFVLESLMHDKTDAEIAAAFTADDPGSPEDNLAVALEKIRSSVLLRPLLS
jgi:hypothetical protein